MLRPNSRVLHLGCGNSPLPEALYDAGFKARPATPQAVSREATLCVALRAVLPSRAAAQDVTSMDYSAPAVEHMRRRNAAARPELRFEVGDARSLTLAPAAYDLVLDKARPSRHHSPAS